MTRHVLHQLLRFCFIAFVQNRPRHMGIYYSRNGGPHVALILLKALEVTCFVALGKSPLCLHLLKL